MPLQSGAVRIAIEVDDTSVAFFMDGALMIKESSLVRTAFFQVGRIVEVIDGTANNWSEAVYFKVRIHDPIPPAPASPFHIISLQEIRELISEERWQSEKLAREADDR